MFGISVTAWTSNFKFEFKIFFIEIDYYKHFKSSNDHINKATTDSEGSFVEKTRKKLNSCFFQCQWYNLILTLSGSYPASHSIDINSIYVYPLNILEQCNKLYLLIFFLTDALNCCSVIKWQT